MSDEISHPHLHQHGRGRSRSRCHSRSRSHTRQSVSGGARGMDKGIRTGMQWASQVGGHVSVPRAAIHSERPFRPAGECWCGVGRTGGGNQEQNKIWLIKTTRNTDEFNRLTHKDRGHSHSHRHATPSPPITTVQANFRPQSQAYQRRSGHLHRHRRHRHMHSKLTAHRQQQHRSPRALPASSASSSRSGHSHGCRARERELRVRDAKPGKLTLHRDRDRGNNEEAHRVLKLVLGRTPAPLAIRSTTGRSLGLNRPRMQMPEHSHPYAQKVVKILVPVLANYTSE